MHLSAGDIAALEQADIGVVIFDPTGTCARENEFFRRLMSGDSERDRVRVEVFRAVRSALNLRVASAAPRSRPAHAEVRARSTRYRVSATFLSESGSREPTLVVALVERLDPTVPTERELGARFLLTRHEIEIAMLVRHGLPTREIASERVISLNTARRHVEKTLLKVDVTNRTAAAAKISGR